MIHKYLKGENIKAGVLCLSENLPHHLKIQNPIENTLNNVDK